MSTSRKPLHQPLVTKKIFFVSLSVKQLLFREKLFFRGSQVMVPNWIICHCCCRKGEDDVPPDVSGHLRDPALTVVQCVSRCSFLLQHIDGWQW